MKLKFALIVFSAAFLVGCEAMKSAIDDAVEGVEQDTEKLGNATDRATNEVDEAINPAKDVSIVLSGELETVASMEVRQLEKTSQWKNIAKVYAMGLEDYSGTVNVILFNEKGTQVEKTTAELNLKTDEPTTVEVKFSEGMNIKRGYMIKLEE